MWWLFGNMLKWKGNKMFIDCFDVNEVLVVIKVKCEVDLFFKVDFEVVWGWVCDEVEKCVLKCKLKVFEICYEL